MTRFIVKNHAEAATACVELPTAARRLATVASEITEPLAALPAAAEPAEVIAAVAQWQRSLSRVERAKAEVVRLLNAAGASPRGIADALGIHAGVVNRLIGVAAAEQGVA